MNLQDLMSKLKNIDEGIEVIGGPIPVQGHADAPKQQDSINMNVSLNGSGAQGVKDLMDILRDIEKGVEKEIEPVHHDAEPVQQPTGHDDVEDEPLLGDMEAQEEEMEEEMGDDGETWGNSAHGDAGAHTHGIDAVTMKGDDMNSKGGQSPLARAPGSNTMIHYHESLVNKLSAMYEEIKGESIEEAYNPNNVSAQHARDMKAHHRAELKKKADAGDDRAKATLKRAEENDAGRRADFDARMERESIELNESADIIKLAKMLKG